MAATTHKDLTRPVVDHEWVLPLASRNDGRALTVSASSELTEYTLPGALLEASPDHPVHVAFDQAGEAMVFAVMADGHLQVVLRPDPSAGWRAVPLTHSLGTEVRVNTFTIAQSRDGSVRVAVSVHGAADQPVHLALPVPNEPSPTAWENLVWEARPDTSAHRVTSIHLGTEDDERGPPLMIVATADESGADRAQHHRVDTTPGARANTWEGFRFPENVTNLVALAVGSHALGRGVYTLYRRPDGGLSLTFTTVPNELGQTSNVDLPVPPGARTLDALPGGRRGFTDLYVGGDGIYLVPVAFQRSRYSEDPAALTVLATPQQSPGVREIVVRDDDHQISVWALTDRGSLQYVQGGKQARYGRSDGSGEEPAQRLSVSADHSVWEEPIVLRNGVERMAPIRNRQASADTVLVQDRAALLRMTQAPESRLWNEARIPLPDDGEVRRAKAFATQLRFGWSDGLPYLPEIESGLEHGTVLRLRLSASDHAQVEVNGRTLAVGPGEGIEVEPDPHGTLTLVAPTDTISSPVFLLASPELGQTLAIEPARKVQDGLRAIRSGDDLTSARLSDGAPLLDESRRAHADAAAKGLADLNGVAESLPRSGRVSAEYLPPPSAHDLPWGQAFGMSFSPGDGLRHFGGEEAAEMMAAAMQRDGLAAANDDWFWSAVQRAVGDVINWARSAITDAFEFVVRQVDRAWQMAIKIGEQVFRFVVECKAHVYDAIHWLLERTLGIDLDRFIRWLGFVFEWQDICSTARAMTAAVNHTLAYAETQVEGLASKVDLFFDHVISEVRAKKDLIRQQEGTGRWLQAAGEAKKAGAPTGAGAGCDAALKSPMGGFSDFALARGGMQGAALLAHPLLMRASERVSARNGRLEEYFRDKVLPRLEEVGGSAKELAGDVRRLFEDRQLTVVQAIELLSADAASTLLAVLKNVVSGLLELTGEVIGTLRDLLNEEIDLPFIGPLFRQLMGGEKLTLLNLFSFVAAVPFTIAFKVLRGTAPFPAGGGDLTRMQPAEFFQRMREHDPAREGANAVDALKVYAWAGGLVSAVLYYFRSRAELVATAAETKIPAAVDAPLCQIQIALTIPFGAWTFENIAGWGVKWILVVKNMYDICMPAETKVGSVLKILATLALGLGNCVKFGYGIATNLERPDQIAYTVWKGVEDVVDFGASLCTGVAGLLPPAPPPGAKYGVALVGAFGQAVRCQLAVYRAAATIVTDNVLVNS